LDDRFFFKLNQLISSWQPPPQGGFLRTYGDYVSPDEHARLLEEQRRRRGYAVIRSYEPNNMDRMVIQPDDVTSYRGNGWQFSGEDI